MATATSTRLAFRALAFEFTIRSDIDGLEEAVQHLFAPWAVGSVGSEATAFDLIARGPAGQPELQKDGGWLQRGNGPGPMLTMLISDVGQISLGGATDHVTVHAGVVSRDGVAVMLPAPPDHGKSTTVVGLVRSGFDFLSDESAAIGLEDGLVHPFARPLMLAPDSMALFPDLRASLPEWVVRFRNLNFMIPPEALRPGCLGGPCEVAFVVAPTYEAGATTTLEPMSRAEMLTLLLRQTFNLSIVGARGVERLAAVLSGADCYRLTIGDVGEAVRLIDGLIEGRSVRSVAAG